MRQSARTIGGAGTGKTTELLEIVAKLLDLYKDPFSIGYISFTRAARLEAATRACQQLTAVRELRLTPDDLMHKDGWFRTIHSTCRRLAGIGGKVVDDDSKWLSESLGTDVGMVASVTSEKAAERNAGGTDAEIALTLWGVARARLQGLEGIVEAARLSDGRTPAWGVVKDIVERYEQGKRLDDRGDYTDMLAAFAGRHFPVDGEPELCTPEGEPPNEVRAWILDEAQDTSPLAWGAFRRLVDDPACEYAYLAGDPFQAIYGWSGSDAKMFMGMETTKQRIAPKSWRCPAVILAKGEEILRRCTDYWDRGIKPADHDGEITRADIKQAVAMVDPAQSWLILTRCRFQTEMFTSRLDFRSVPWRPVKGYGGTWQAPKRARQCFALMALESGSPIGADEWPDVCDAIKLPVKKGDEREPLLVRGAKAKWGRMKKPDFESIGLLTLNDERHSEFMGVTDKLVELITTGAWRRKGVCLVSHADRFTQSVRDWGTEAWKDTQVKVGTIHSTKGMEADNVILLTSTSGKIKQSMLIEEDANAEHRVWYVGATRARKRLVIVREGKGKGAFPEYDL